MVLDTGGVLDRILFLIDYYAEQKSESTPNKIGILPCGKTASLFTISPSPVSKFQISVDLKMNLS